MENCGIAILQKFRTLSFCHAPTQRKLADCGTCFVLACLGRLGMVSQFRRKSPKEAKKFWTWWFFHQVLFCRLLCYVLHITIGKQFCSVELSRFSNWLRSTNILLPITFTFRCCFTRALILFLEIGRNSFWISLIVRNFLVAIVAVITFLLLFIFHYVTIE